MNPALLFDTSAISVVTIEEEIEARSEVLDVRALCSCERDCVIGVGFAFGLDRFLKEAEEGDLLVGAEGV